MKKKFSEIELKDVEKILFLKKKGVSRKAIVEQINVTYYTFDTILEQNGIIDNVKRKCSNCKKFFKVKNSKERLKRKFCSQKCGLEFVNKINKTDVSRKQQSDRMKKKLLAGEIVSNNCLWYNVECSQGIVKAQGKFEVRAIKILDKLIEENKIINWKRNEDFIKYIDINNLHRNYLPDFKLFDKNGFYYLEIKGYLRENDILKLNGVKNKNLRIEIWFDRELKMFEKQILSSVGLEL